MTKSQKTPRWFKITLALLAGPTLFISGVLWWLFIKFMEGRDFWQIVIVLAIGAFVVGMIALLAETFTELIGIDPAEYLDRIKRRTRRPRK